MTSKRALKITVASIAVIAVLIVGERHRGSYRPIRTNCNGAGMVPDGPKAQ
jgi:hypothetical protein